jgi:hypothetical protein
MVWHQQFGGGGGGGGGVVGFVVVAAKATPPLNAGAAGELSTRAIESTKLGTNIVVNLL